MKHMELGTKVSFDDKRFHFREGEDIAQVVVRVTSVEHFREMREAFSTTIAIWTNQGRIFADLTSKTPHMHKTTWLKWAQENCTYMKVQILPQYTCIDFFFHESE